MHVDSVVKDFVRIQHMALFLYGLTFQTSTLESLRIAHEGLIVQKDDILSLGETAYGD